jgi:peptidoglycan/xylan/chitin deacetylase (PgdA/CDA1 family)
MTLLVVNYHYVAVQAAAAPRAIFPVTTDALARQLELLGRAFEFVDRDRLIAAVEGTASLPAKACLITFDDGLREQAEVALPVLERAGVPALFLVCGRPLLERRALYVHKVHYLRELLPEEEFALLLTRQLDELGFGLEVDEARARETYPYDTETAARLKYVLNMLVPLEWQERLIDVLLGAVGEDEAALHDRLYLTPAQLAELERGHGAVGAHSHAHAPLARLDARALGEDLAANAAALELATGVHPRVISYPYGTAEAVSPHVAAAAADAGFRVGFTMERALNETLEDPLLLARLDVNDVPGGSSPLLELVGAEVVVGPGVSPDRRRYVVETPRR